MGSLLHSIAQLPFVIGVARSLDLLGVLNQPNPYRRFANPAEADAAAAARDWQIVGEDLTIGLRQFEEEAGLAHGSA